MDRAAAIEQIKQLYPPGENEFGDNLLAEAKRRCSSWENEPDPVIFMLLHLCRDYEAKQTARLLRENKW